MLLIHVLVYMCACVDTSLSTCMLVHVWRPEKNLGVISQDNLHFLRQNHSLAWDSPSRLGELASEP